MSRVTLRAVSDGIVSLQVATDEQPYIDAQLEPALADAIAAVTADPAIRAVVLEGGARTFCGGGSLGALLEIEVRPMYIYGLPRLILSIPVPTVAAMVGHGVGGGLILGLWSDIPVLAEESLYGANFMKLGFTPGMGSTRLLEECVGGPLAREMLFTGRMVKGKELKAGGGPLAHAIYPRGRVRERAYEVANAIADIPRDALVELKRTLSARRLALLQAADAEETAMHGVFFGRESTRRRILERYAK